MMSFRQRFLTSLFMSFFMALIMSGIIIGHQVGVTHPEFGLNWRDSFLFAWPIAFLAAFCIQPLVKHLVEKVISE